MTLNNEPTPFDRIGETTLMALITEFVEEVKSDVMIGYMFNNIANADLIQREYEFTARFLGNKKIKYSGRPIGEAHRKFNIFGGQFARRTQILKEKLVQFDIDVDIQKIWLNHIEQLRGQVTKQSDTICE